MTFEPSEPYDDFNSIKVRLKLQTNQVVESVREFQFHKGTIKTIHYTTAVGMILLFQFHKGTIKTAKNPLS